MTSPHSYLQKSSRYFLTLQVNMGASVKNAYNARDFIWHAFDACEPPFTVLILREWILEQLFQFTSVCNLNTSTSHKLTLTSTIVKRWWYFDNLLMSMLLLNFEFKYVSANQMVHFKTSRTTIVSNGQAIWSQQKDDCKNQCSKA